ncbi:MAG TPA: zf-HC2 domain-containing protein [Terriglobia bacterium]|nr:zf-HC2 domain-containing protein [Terriglobia bacterium]
MKVLNFDAKPCERVREQLDAYLSSELMVETTATVLKHLEGCPDCSRELESRQRLRDALRRAVDQELPPEHLGETIHRRLQQTRPRFTWPFRGSSPSRSWMLALAGLAAVVLVGVTFQHGVALRRGRQLVASVLTLGVSDHLNCAIRGHHYPDVARPASELRAQLGPEYAPLLPVVEQKLPGFEVLEAHICTVPGSPRKYVHFIARGRGTILSVILTRREGEALPSDVRLVAETTGGVSLYENHLGGMDVAGFETNDYFGFVVSDLGQDSVVQLAAVLAPSLRTQLDGG